jgi:ketosteroid isomerase-like protein
MTQAVMTQATTRDQMLDLGQRWADAERRADVAALDALLAGDFTAVGPLGFVLNREQYLGSRRSGDLKTDVFSWGDAQVRVYGQVAVAVGIVTQEAVYQGQKRPEASGRFRVTQVAVQQDGQWVFASIQFSGPIPNLPQRQG